MTPFRRFFAPSIRRRILAGFVIVALLVLAMAVATFYQLSQVQTSSEQMIPNSSQMGYLQSLGLATSALDADLERFLVIRGAEYRDSVLQDLANMTGALDEMRRDAGAAAQPVVQELQDIVTRLQTEASALLEVGAGAATTDINQRIVEVYADIDQVKQLQQTLSAETLTQLQATAATQGRITSDVITQTAILGLAVFAIAVVASLLINRTMRPIGALTETATAIAAGDLNRTAPVQSQDEIGTLAQSFNTMTGRLRDLIDSLETRVELRTAQVQASADVGRAVTSILDAEQLLSTIVNVVTERFGFYYTAIFILDHAHTYLVLREATGEAGRILKERGHRLRVGLDSMVGYAVLKREPRVVLNAGEDAVRFANPLLPDTQSEVAVPLLVGDQVLGALDVQATQLNAFDETVIATLQNVAAQIAVALQNAQSYSGLQQALTFATRQYELSRAIVTAQTSTEAYEAVGQVFALLSGVDRISLLRVSERDAFDLPSEYELATEWDVLGGAQFDTGLRYTAAETPLARLVAADEAVIIRDAGDNRLPLATREQLNRAGVQAAILVPLIIRSQFGGFIAATAEQPHDFQDSEVRLLRSVAEQLGVVLSNLQLTNEMQTALDRVALLNRRLSGEAWSSYLLSRDQWLVESGHAQPVTANTLQVPIVVRGETIGTFDVADARDDRQWQEDELNILQTIAGEVALAIENSRLIEQTQRTAQREKDIAHAADKIHRSINLDAILQTAVEEVMRIAGTTNVAIQLGHDPSYGKDRRLAAADVESLPQADALPQP